MFDIIQYRNANAEVELAAAFPAGFKTYENLAKRCVWFKEAARFSFIWISRDGHATIE